ncbi:MAG TPA: ABC transporter ATP-binding protein [Candidatus Pullichristensenella stercorigallinarum]|uniref:ABC transporter ATP-binding protein n=1 Tax=Candidatus Pullichristensenella stercorigallinarum TaxID=2840909 RepID=A0A9D1CXH4_9FIRM|nr:ABC transporter ATP-binding protein [Candidatus Pullichristensenella stercorigallinarum]
MTHQGTHRSQAGLSLKNMDRSALKRLIGYIMRRKGTMLVVLLCIALSSIANVASALFLQRLIDEYIAPLLLEAAPVFTGLLKAIATMACIYLVGILSSLFYNRLMATVAQSTLKDIRDDMFSHMQTLPLRYFDTHTHGDVMSYYTNDTDTLRQMISQSLPQVVSAAVTLITVLVSMLSLSLYLTAFAILYVCLMLVVSRKIAGRSGKYFVRQQKSLGDLNGYIEEMINGQRVVKVFCHEEEAEKAFDGRNEELCHNASRANGYGNMLMPVMVSLSSLLYVMMALIGGSLAIAGVTNVSITGAGVFTLGTIASFMQLSRSFTQPINQVSQQLNSVVMALAGAGRIFQLLDEPSEADDGYVTLQKNANGDGWEWRHPHHDGTVTTTPLQGEVRMYNVDFAYEQDKEVLHDITLYAEPGQKVAFVGATGAGKTTITNLINRFYDIKDGKIRYDGINIGKIKKDDLRRSLGVVLQDVNLFTGTVMDNIRYGKLDATDEECIAAAKLANAHSFISRLPKGYDTMLEGDGSGLSQGQRQLISIARAAVANPPVMILDEATSSIDTRTEALVQKGMDALMKGRTVFVIAHRLSTVQNSDVIMVLDHGRIIERGTHEQLLEQKGTYYKLYTGAFELS